MGFKLKRVAKQLSYRKRFLSICSHDQVRSRRIKKVILAFMARLKNVKLEQAERTSLDTGLRLLIARYLSLVAEPDIELEKPVKLNRTIESFSESDCRIFFAFDKADLPRLLGLLQIPNVVRFPNRAKMSGEEILLRGLYELVSGETQHKISTNVFGRDLTAQSRAFTWFINHMFNTFHHLVDDNLQWWFTNGFFEQSAAAIGRKMDMGAGHHNHVAHFIDCNCLQTSVTGGGPGEEGVNAMRWDPQVQRAFYNGWKSIHGLKHQTVDNAFGMTIDMCGPTSLRHNDLYVLRQSQVNERMMALQLAYVIQYTIFGDSAYHTRSHIGSYLHAVQNIEDWQRWNGKMKKVRQSIEWNYGYTACKFKYVQNEWKMKILQAGTVAKIYTVVTFLRNCVVALYGCETSNYFDLDLPDNFLENYITQTNFN